MSDLRIEWEIPVENGVFFKNQKNNYLADHLWINNHSFPDDSGFKLIKAEQDQKLISAIESLEILNPIIKIQNIA